MDMIDPAVLAFDIDGVVADAMTLFLEIAHNKHGVSGISKEDITSYMLEDCLSMDPDIILDVIGDIIEGTHTEPLLPIEGAVASLQRIHALGTPLLFVTARPRRKPVEDWLRNALGITNGDLHVVATGSFEAKIDVLAQHGRSWFVEDRLETCILLADAGVIPVLFRQPWNRKPHPFFEVGGWDELLPCIKGL